MTGQEPSVRGIVASFGGVAVLWLLLAGAICWKTAPTADEAERSVKWLTGLWALCMVDFLAIAQLMRAVFRIMVHPESQQAPALDEAQKVSADRVFWVIRASTWGALKLACLVLIGVVLSSGTAVPSIGMALGLGTLGVVPVFGGLLAYQRGFRHA